MFSLFEMLDTVDRIIYLVVFGLVLIITRFCCTYLRYIWKLPPGPIGLPVVGYWPLVKNGSHLKFVELARRYGSMFSTRIGNQLVVVISDYRLLRDAFRKEEFTARPRTPLDTDILDGYGVISSDGKLWKDQRRFLHQQLRQFGMKFSGAGRELLEARIMREVETVMQIMYSTKGRAEDLNPVLGLAVSNVICDILMTQSFTTKDSRFARFMHLIDEGFALFGQLTMTNLVPLLRHLPSHSATRQKLNQNRIEMAEYFQEIIDEHRKTFDSSNIRDIVDTYLLEIERATLEGNVESLFQGKDHDRQMQQILGDLFSAGMETIKTTLQWAMVFMLHHPIKAHAVQLELDAVVGRKRLPRLEDMPFLPLTEATLLEVLRRSSIVPLGTTHATTKDVMFNDYLLPQGTQVIPLLHSIHMDPNLWDQPEKFNPRRFLNHEGKVQKPEFFMPFGVGRRMCLGDVLARMELFLFFSAMMHVFHMVLPADTPLPSLKGNIGVTVTPQPFKVCLLPRPFDVDMSFMKMDLAECRKFGC